MELRQLGKTNIKITPIILGSWAIGGWMWGGTEEEDSIKAIQTSLDNGINAIDTAPVYGMGYCEEIIKKAIKGRRDKVILATKCGMRWDGNEGADPWLQKNLQGENIIIRKNSKPASIRNECEQSLKRLGVDVIDLYQIHWPDSTTPIEDSWREMVKLKEEGKVRAIGVSNYNLEQLKQAYAIHPVDSIQPPYSLIRRNIEEDIVPFCQEKQISIIVYSPLERGLLTGKVTMERTFSETDHRKKHPYFQPEIRKRILEALEEIQPIAVKHNATVSQIILNVTYHRPGITGVIVGARNQSQALENAKAADLSLSKEECDLILECLNQHKPVTAK